MIINIKILILATSSAEAAVAEGVDGHEGQVLGHRDQVEYARAEPGPVGSSLSLLKSDFGKFDSNPVQIRFKINHATSPIPALLEVEEAEAVDDSDDGVVEPLLPPLGAEVGVLVDDPEGHGEPVHEEDDDHPLLQGQGQQHHRRYPGRQHAEPPDGLQDHAGPGHLALLGARHPHGGAGE